MTARCHKCGLPIEARDLVEEENEDDPFEPFHFHIWCAPNATDEEKQQEP